MSDKKKTKSHPKKGGVEEQIPLGVKVLRTLEGNQDSVLCVTFDPMGKMIGSGSEDGTVKLWDARSGILLHTLKGHQDMVWSVAIDPLGSLLASGSTDKTIKLWDTGNGRLIGTLKGHLGKILSVGFDPIGGMLGSGSADGTVKLWEARSGKLLHTLSGHQEMVWSVDFNPLCKMLASGSTDKTIYLWNTENGKLFRKLLGHKEKVLSVAFDPMGLILASGSWDNTVKLWDTHSGRLLRTLEGHTSCVCAVVFSEASSLLASKSYDGTVRLWSCVSWECVAVISVPNQRYSDLAALCSHPTLPWLVTDASDPDLKNSCLIRLWELDVSILLGTAPGAKPPARAVHHTTGKIVLVGDHSVGKSALGYRLIHGKFRAQASTHGQQFWLFSALSKRRVDGTDCEAILWDFAGQPDYRLVHTLFVDDADLALVLFDAANINDPLHGVGFWLKQLQSVQNKCPIILVATQTDRGTCSLTQEELQAFCQQNKIEGPITTSAFTGLGITELLELMKSLIRWEEKAETVTTTTFKRIKDYVLGLKEAKVNGQTIVTPEELRHCLETTDKDWHFSDAEMLTAVGHLENYGYVKRLRTSQGDQRILLQPDLLNNLASSFVLEARRNPKGLGALEEKRLLSSGYYFSELKGLTAIECGVLLDSATLLFLKHNVCFRETDPLRTEPYIVFPELINLKKPLEEEQAPEDGMTYTVIGPTENVFASLVVLMGYTQTFTRTSQWQNNARYVVGDNLICGFRQEAEREGELNFVLCFRPDVGLPVRTLFQGLFESFLGRRNLTVTRYDTIRCDNLECGNLLDRFVIRQRMKEGKTFAFCNECGKKLSLPKMAEPIQLTRKVQTEVEAQRRTAEQRSRFEQAIFQVHAYIISQNRKPPKCFISYAWGVIEHERWIEKQLATDLQKAGIEVILDRWNNAQIGKSISRFIERIENSDLIVMVGTPLYLRKYENKDTSTGYVVAAEVDLIANRLLGTEKQKESVLPILLQGDDMISIPPLLHGRVYADFRKELMYFSTAFDLILSLYKIPPNHPAVSDLRESLRGSEMDL